MLTFKQNRAGAVTMALIVVISALIVTGMFGIYDYVTSPQPEDDLAFLIASGVLFGVLFGGIMTAIIAVLIHDLDARHWGRKGAARWLFVGVWYGVWWGIALRLLPGFESAFVERTVHWALQIAIVVWAYWLAFYILRPAVGENKNGGEP